MALITPEWGTHFYKMFDISTTLRVVSVVDGVWIQVANGVVYMGPISLTRAHTMYNVYKTMGELLSCTSAVPVIKNIAFHACYLEWNTPLALFECDGRTEISEAQAVE